MSKLISGFAFINDQVLIRKGNVADIFNGLPIINGKAGENKESKGNRNGIAKMNYIFLHSSGDER
jgi:hypothetical protein